MKKAGEGLMSRGRKEFHETGIMSIGAVIRESELLQYSDEYSGDETDAIHAKRLRGGGGKEEEEEEESPEVRAEINLLSQGIILFVI